jgi:hypothetical protein
LQREEEACNAMTHRYARRKERRRTDRHRMPPYNLPPYLPPTHRANTLCLLVLLLHLMRRLLIDIALGPCNSEALPDLHIGLGLSQQRVANILLAARSPAVEALVAKGPNGHIAIAGHELGSDGRRLGSDAVDVHLELLAEGLERQVVNVVAEGVLDLAADGR